MSGRLPEERVQLPLLKQDWKAVAFLHWPVDAAVISRLLPPGLEPDIHEESGWLTLTPFLVEHCRPVGSPSGVGTAFPETNLRTYVIGPDGRDGIWFFTLEVASAAFAAVGGVVVPYRWAEAEVEQHEHGVRYRGARRNHSDVHWEIEVEPHGPLAVTSPTDEWLTGRWRAWTSRGTTLATVAVRHEPWPLWSAAPVTVDETLTTACDLPALGPPVLTHWSPGVHVALGWPHLAAGP